MTWTSAIMRDSLVSHWLGIIISPLGRFTRYICVLYPNKHITLLVYSSSLVSSLLIKSVLDKERRGDYLGKTVQVSLSLCLSRLSEAHWVNSFLTFHLFSGCATYHWCNSEVDWTCFSYTCWWKRESVRRLCYRTGWNNRHGRIEFFICIRYCTHSEKQIWFVLDNLHDLM